jgi:hypothetical protein
VAGTGSGLPHLHVAVLPTSRNFGHNAKKTDISGGRIFLNKSYLKGKVLYSNLMTMHWFKIKV